MSFSVESDIEAVCQTHPDLCEKIQNVRNLEDLFSALPESLETLQMVKQDEFSLDLVIALEDTHYLVIGAG